MPYPSLGKVVSYTWATLPNPTTNNGTEVFVTDVGISGSKWKSNGTIYVPLAPIVLYRAYNLSNSGTDTAEEAYAISSKIPNGVLAIGRVLEINFLIAKSGTSEVTTNVVKIGTNSNGVTGAAAISSNLSLSTTSRQLGHRQGNVIVSATEVQNYTIGSSAASSGTSTSAAVGKRTITNIANDMYVSLTRTMTTGGIETVSALYFEVKLL